MRKSKLYLDTSLISHLEAQDTPEKMNDTLLKHFVNIKTINKVQAVNKLVGYSDISILPPSMLVEGDETDDQ